MMVQAPEESVEGSEISRTLTPHPLLFNHLHHSPRRNNQEGNRGKTLRFLNPVVLQIQQLIKSGPMRSLLPILLMINYISVFDEQEVEVEKVVSTAEVTTVSATTTTVDVLTLAQTLIEIKAAKPKAVTTAATTTTTAVTRPKARGVVVQDPSEFTKTASPSQLSQAPRAKEKGKEKMIELEKLLKKKDQILIDEEIS
ncbi:hypothetical protein Tco_0270472 [Tanacetum coccineum]